MRSLLVLIPALLLYATAANAQYSIELDGDGVLGNGPDYVFALAANAVSVDAYVTGQASQVYSANFTLRHLGPGTWNSYTHATGWTTTPDQNQGGNDWLVQATDFGFLGLVPPFLHGTAHYTFDGPFGIVAVSIEQPNGWFDSSFTTGPFGNNTGLIFGHIVFSTEESSWGAVKELFR